MSNNTATLSVPSSVEINDEHAAMIAELARLRAENQALKVTKATEKAKKEGVKSLKISEKGCISVYNLQRFPVSLYADAWIKLAEKMPEILKFIEDNRPLIDEMAAKHNAEKAEDNK